MNRLDRLPLELLQNPHIWRGSDLAQVSTASLPTGFAELDRELPGNGWPVGALTEVLPKHEGIGELRLFGPTLAQLSAKGKTLVWVAPPYLPYAPAIQAVGIDLSHLWIVRTCLAKDTLWVIEQSLRSNACGAVLGWLPQGSFRELKRLTLAAEGSEALAVIFRDKESHEPSPAALKIRLETAHGGLALHIVKRRGGPLTQPIVLSAFATALKRNYSDKNDVMARAPFSAASSRDLLLPTRA
jgi:hypothetical protein